VTDEAPFLSDDAIYAITVIMPEMARDFEQYSKEYKAARLLGVRAEFVEVHRKTQKLKAALWDNVDTSDWREQPRQIFKELASHCMLAIRSLDLDDEQKASEKDTDELKDPGEASFGQCPTCRSKYPRLHQATQDHFGGNVGLCGDTWHEVSNWRFHGSH